jgi:hypothetical protein|tara:strand:- start:48 stop:437 length:390 start_codon:yes stop_codon:yes gene_type:complete
MKKTLLILILSLLSIQGFAKVGDVYYCEMTQAIELKEGKLINYIPQKFKFTIDSENMIRFGLDANYFKGSAFEVIEFSDNGEQFYGDNFEYSYGDFYFAEVFRLVSTGVDALTATAVSATCAILEDYAV